MNSNWWQSPMGAFGSGIGGWLRGIVLTLGAFWLGTCLGLLLFAGIFTLSFWAPILALLASFATLSALVLIPGLLVGLYKMCLAETWGSCGIIFAAVAGISALNIAYFRVVLGWVSVDLG